MKNIILVCFMLLTATNTWAQNDQAGPYTQTVYFSPSEGLQGSVTISYGYKVCYDQILMVLGWSNLNINSYRRNGKKYFAADLGLSNFQGEVIGMKSITANTYNKSTKRSYGSARGNQVQRNFTLGCFGETISITPKDSFQDNINQLNSEFTDVQISYSGSLSFKADNVEKAKQNKIKYDQALRQINNTSSNERKLELIRDAYKYTKDNSELNNLRDRIRQEMEAERQREIQNQNAEDTSGLSNQSVYLEVDSGQGGGSSYGNSSSTSSYSNTTNYGNTQYSNSNAPEKPDPLAEYNRIRAQHEQELALSRIAFQQKQEKIQVITNAAVQIGNAIDQAIRDKRARQQRWQEQQERNKNAEIQELSEKKMLLAENRNQIQVLSEEYDNGTIGYQELIKAIQKYDSNISNFKATSTEFRENKSYLLYNDNSYSKKMYEYIIATELGRPNQSLYRRYLVLQNTKFIWLKSSFNGQQRHSYLAIITEHLSTEEQAYKRSLIKQMNDNEYVIAILKAKVDVNDMTFYRNWMETDGKVKRYIQNEYQGPTIIILESIVEGKNTFVARDLKSGNMGYINKEGKWSIKPVYDEALPFKDNIAFVTNNMTPRGGTHWVKIDADNNALASTEQKGVFIIKDISILEDQGDYYPGIKEDGMLIGLLDKNFNWALPPKYLRIELTDETVILTNKNHNQKTIRIDEL